MRLLLIFRKGSVGYVYLSVFHITAPREHLHVWPFVVALATQYAIHLVYRCIDINALFNHLSEYAHIRAV